MKLRKPRTPVVDFAALIATAGKRIAWAWQQYEGCDTETVAQVSLSIVYSELAAAGESL